MDIREKIIGQARPEMKNRSYDLTYEQVDALVAIAEATQYAVDTGALQPSSRAGFALERLQRVLNGELSKPVVKPYDGKKRKAGRL